VPDLKLGIETLERGGELIDASVAVEDLQPGDVALRIPESLVVTLNRCGWATAPRCLAAQVARVAFFFFFKKNPSLVVLHDGCGSHRGQIGHVARQPGHTQLVAHDGRCTE
jgi:hypothetical protein